MRFFTLFAAVAATAVFAQDATTPAPTSTQCDLTKLMPLAGDANLLSCTKESGLQFSLTSPPTSIPPDTLSKFCVSKDCLAFLDTVTSLNLGDCAFGGFKIVSDLIEPAKKACKSSSNNQTNSTSGTAGGSSTSKNDVPSPSNPVPSPSPTNAASVAQITISVAVAAVVAAVW